MLPVTQLPRDANGNMLDGIDGQDYERDASNRLKRVVHGAVTTTFLYGPDGARLAKTVAGATSFHRGMSEVTPQGDVIIGEKCV